MNILDVAYLYWCSLVYCFVQIMCVIVINTCFWVFLFYTIKHKNKKNVLGSLAECVLLHYAVHTGPSMQLTCMQYTVYQFPGWQRNPFYTFNGSIMECHWIYMYGICSATAACVCPRTLTINLFLCGIYPNEHVCPFQSWCDWDLYIFFSFFFVFKVKKGSTVYRYCKIMLILYVTSRLGTPIV